MSARMMRMAFALGSFALGVGVTLLASAIVPDELLRSDVAQQSRALEGGIENSSPRPPGVPVVERFGTLEHCELVRNAQSYRDQVVSVRTRLGQTIHGRGFFDFHCEGDENLIAITLSSSGEEQLRQLSSRSPWPAVVAKGRFTWAEATRASDAVTDRASCRMEVTELVAAPSEQEEGKHSTPKRFQRKRSQPNP
jgi:hypothetical protein